MTSPSASTLTSSTVFTGDFAWHMEDRKVVKSWWPVR